MVRLSFAAAVEDLVEGVGVGIPGDPAEVPDHQLAGARVAQMLGPLLLQELGAQPDAVHLLAPELVGALAAAVGRRRDLEHELRAVGPFAIAVAVAVDVAVGVEQRLGLRRVVLGERPGELGVEAERAGRDGRLRRYRLAVVNRADPFRGIDAERDRAVYYR